MRLLSCLSLRRVPVGTIALIGAAWAVSGTTAADTRASLSRVGCRAQVAVHVLPRWARGGFSDARPRMPFVLGTKDAIAAILWADPLLAPPPKHHNNKILWVSRLPVDGSDLRISAQRFVDSKAQGQPIHRRVQGGPGPSIMNLPTAGCYRLKLRWSGHTDTLTLEYKPRS